MRSMPLATLVAGCLCVVALAMRPPAGAAQADTEPPTYSETIAPIVYATCVECHRAGGAAPFPLVSYEDIARRATLVAAVTRSRSMPPWHPAHGYGEFVGERRLTDEQIALIGEWAARGVPRGDPASMPDLPVFTDAWQLGEPDLVLEMTVGFDVPADGPDVYRNFVLPTGLTEDRWVRAVELRPQARRAVHHALFAYASGGSLSQRDGADGQPGFAGSMAVGVLPGPGGSGGLGGWAVGGRAMIFPDGLEARLPAGSDFLLQVHFNWQEFYTYARPVSLPRGTRLEATLRYDNSEGNSRNPHSPPRRVQWGLESSDEMGTIGLLLEILDRRDEPALRRALEERTQAAIQRGVADGTVRRYLAQQAAMDAR
jgi:mono/diheme cytochrome c family protein